VRQVRDGRLTIEFEAPPAIITNIPDTIIQTWATEGSAVAPLQKADAVSFGFIAVRNSGREGLHGRTSLMSPIEGWEMSLRLHATVAETR